MEATHANPFGISQIFAHFAQIPPIDLSTYCENYVTFINRPKKVEGVTMNRINQEPKMDTCRECQPIYNDYDWMVCGRMQLQDGDNGQHASHTVFNDLYQYLTFFPNVNVQGLSLLDAAKAIQRSNQNCITKAFSQACYPAPRISWDLNIIAELARRNLRTQLERNGHDLESSNFPLGFWDTLICACKVKRNVKLQGN